MWPITRHYLSLSNVYSSTFVRKATMALHACIANHDTYARVLVRACRVFAYVCVLTHTKTHIHTHTHTHTHLLSRIAASVEYRPPESFTLYRPDFAPTPPPPILDLHLSLNSGTTN